ncbi:MAG: DMT family transporter [Clostridium sp.]|nr:DMT family transporter [Clostridium sp.]
MNERIRNRTYLPFFAMTCAVLWALAYPLIKLGFRELGISADDIGSRILFSGIRFFTAGILVLFFSRFKNVDQVRERPSLWGWLFLFALVNTYLHYLTSYIGLAYIPSSRGTIVDSSGSFILILLSCLLFSDDTLTNSKILGCILGFSGILLLNLEPGQSFFENISLRGDGMVFLNAVCAALGGILSRLLSRRMDMTAATGISMTLGGAGLLLTGAAAGVGAPWNITPLGIAVTVALAMISAVSFTIYNTLLGYHPMSSVAIYNAFIPVFGVIFAHLILGEPFRLKYLVCGLLVAAGIITVNRGKAVRQPRAAAHA